MAAYQARMRFSHEVVKEDVEEALRLIYASKASLTEYSAERTRARNPVDEIFKIFQVLHQNSTKPQVRYWGNGQAECSVSQLSTASRRAVSAPLPRATHRSSSTSASAYTKS